MNGILVIDKPAGMTSHDAVKQVRKLTGERSIGHLGTLDPMATGVLPLLLGKYTRLAQFFGSSEKEYEGTIRLGFSTDTYDAEGTPTSVAVEPQFKIEKVRIAAASLTGKIQQLPPAYSAKKIAGVPAYKLARKDKPVELAPVDVEVKEFVLEQVDAQTLSFRTAVSSGTYVRSLAHDLGQILGCGAHLTSLRRVQSGEFNLRQALELESLRVSMSDNEDYVNQRNGQGWVHPREVLKHFPAVTTDEASLAKIRTGSAVNLPVFGNAATVKVFADKDNLAAIANRIAGTLFHPAVVLL